MLSQLKLNRPGVMVALLIMLLLSSWFAPGGDRTAVQQIDFWLVWLLCMVVLALPLTLLETALARRSQSSPLQALSTLTREADVAPVWRLVGWLAVAAIGLIAGGMAHQAAMYLNEGIAQQTSLPLSDTMLFALILPLAAVGLSFVARPALIIGLVAGLAAVEWGTFTLGIGHWQMTSFSLSEWANAVVLALVATGLGLGLYWQSALEKPEVDTALHLALPIWLAQLAGGIMFALSQGLHTLTAKLLFAIALVCGAGYLVALLRQQLIARGLPMIMQWLAILVALGVWIIPETVLWTALASVLGLIVCLVYAIFSGWQMKISHLRKSLNFDSELHYNLWRVAVRLVIPLAIVIAIVGMIAHWVRLA